MNTGRTSYKELKLISGRLEEFWRGNVQKKAFAKRQAI
jgi:hypothetical protein